MGVSINDTGKVTPDSVAPNEPIIETTLIIRPRTGNNENKNKAKDWVAKTNRHNRIFSIQRLQGRGILIHPKNTQLANKPTTIKTRV